MLATALIVFREIFEVSLIVSIVMAATRGIVGRALWVLIGLVAGVLGSGLVAVFAGQISALGEGMGQELLNATVLGIAVVMLGWHNIWMSRHGREMALDMNRVGHDVAAGSRPLSALAVVVGLAMLREGSEIVLFLWGIAASDANPVMQMVAGGIAGLVGGCLIGLALYLGLVRVPQRYIFAVTSWMIVLLAAGMASQAMGFLRQADLVPALGNSVWDTSWLVSDKGFLGRALHTLVGYTSRPDGIQLIAFGVTLGVIVVMMRLIGKANPPASASAR